jgi:glyoxylase-like metal-dependent hydrolase (beta-lactamase superfamily II)
MTESPSYLHSRRLGAFTVTAITEGLMPWSPELNVPEEVWRGSIAADGEGKVPIDTHVLLVQTGDAVVLIDTGLDDPGSPWEERWLQEWPGSTRTPGVTAGLASLGIFPHDVTHVLLTHAHFDHYVGLTVERDGVHAPRYPLARVFMGRADWEGNPERDEPESDLPARIGTIEGQGLLHLVEGEREIVPGITMIPAPGESPGHTVVQVTSDGETLYAVGDLFHHASEIEHLDWIVPWADEEQMAASRRLLLDAATASNALVVFTHETFPPWGTIIETSNGYHWQRASSP